MPAGFKLSLKQSLKCGSEAFSESCQIYEMEFFVKIVNNFHPLTVFTKNSILDIWQGSKYTAIASCLVWDHKCQWPQEILNYRPPACSNIYLQPLNHMIAVGGNLFFVTSLEVKILSFSIFQQKFMKKYYK